MASISRHWSGFDISTEMISRRHRFVYSPTVDFDAKAALAGTARPPHFDPSRAGTEPAFAFRRRHLRPWTSNSSAHVASLDHPVIALLPTPKATARHGRPGHPRDVIVRRLDAGADQTHARHSPPSSTSSRKTPLTPSPN
jgi:hypothetical protein